MPTLNAISEEAWQNAQEAGWHAAKPDELGVVRGTSTFERLGLVHSEVSEAFEAFRKHGAKRWYEEGGKPEGLESELADIIIRVCELAYFFPGYDLDEAVFEKMQYNKRRSDVPARKGGKSI